MEFETTIFAPCPGVEIGRQATLRWWCSQGRAGSNPVLGTKQTERFAFLFVIKRF